MVNWKKHAISSAFPSKSCPCSCRSSKLLATAPSRHWRKIKQKDKIRERERAQRKYIISPQACIESWCNTALIGSIITWYNIDLTGAPASEETSNIPDWNINLTIVKNKYRHLILAPFRAQNRYPKQWSPLDIFANKPTHTKPQTNHQTTKTKFHLDQKSSKPGTNTRMGSFIYVPFR